MIIFSIRRTSRREKKCRLSIIIIDSPDDDDDVALKATTTTVLMMANQNKRASSTIVNSTASGANPTDGESRRRHRRLAFGEEVRWLLLRHVWLFRLFHAHAGQRAVMVRPEPAVPEIYARRHVLLERRCWRCHHELGVENDRRALPLLPRRPVFIRRGNHQGVFETSHRDVVRPLGPLRQRHVLFAGG